MSHTSQLQLNFGLPNLLPAGLAKVSVFLPDNLLVLFFTFHTICLHSLLSSICLSSCTSEWKRIRNGVEHIVPEDQPALLCPSSSDQPLLQISYQFPEQAEVWPPEVQGACSIISLLFPDSFKCHHFTVVYPQAVGLAESLYWSDCPAPMLKDSETTIRGMGCSFQATHNFMIQETIQLHQCSSFSVLS